MIGQGALVILDPSIERGAIVIEIRIVRLKAQRAVEILKRPLSSPLRLYATPR